MTPEQLLKGLQDFDERIKYAPSEIVRTGISKGDVKLLISVTSKQVPLPPKTEDGEHYCCPNCGQFFGKQRNYCHECGQRLKWSDNTMIKPFTITIKNNNDGTEQTFNTMSLICSINDNDGVRTIVNCNGASTMDVAIAIYYLAERVKEMLDAEPTLRPAIQFITEYNKQHNAERDGSETQ